MRTSPGPIGRNVCFKELKYAQDGYSFVDPLPKFRDCIKDGLEKASFLRLL